MPLLEGPILKTENSDDWLNSIRMIGNNLRITVQKNSLRVSKRFTVNCKLLIAAVTARTTVIVNAHYHVGIFAGT